MNNYFEANNIDELYLQAIERVSSCPQNVVKPRGMEVKEIMNAVLVLTNPKNCVVTLKDRKLNYAFTAMEKIQYLTGQSETERLLFYNSNFSSWLNKYGGFDGDYGQRIHYWLEYIYRLLKFDPDTRQAIFTIYGIQDRHESKDIPCTVMHHYMVRDGKLNLTVYMRSNDLLWGFPYDVNAFCFIQEFLAAALGVELGTYTHIAGSLHLYTEREEQLTKLIGPVREYNLKENPKIEKNIDFFGYLSKMNIMLDFERRLRHAVDEDEEQEILMAVGDMGLPKSIKDYFNVFANYISHKKWEKKQ